MNATNSKTNLQNVNAKAKAAIKEAVRKSGCSEMVFEALIQRSFAALLEEAPEAEREAIEAELIELGYEPDFIPDVPGEGMCPITGTDVKCCPCGHA